MALAHTTKPIGQIGASLRSVPELRADFDFIVEGSIHNPKQRERLETCIDDVLAWTFDDRTSLTDLSAGLLTYTLTAHGLHKLVRVHANLENAVDAGYYHEVAQVMLERALKIHAIIEHKGIANMPNVSSGPQ